MRPSARARRCALLAGAAASLLPALAWADDDAPATTVDTVIVTARPDPEAGSLVGEITTHEQLAVLRRELNGLVAAWHHRTGQPHGITHAALRKECGGPAAAVANADQLRTRIERIREWAARKTS